MSVVIIINPPPTKPPGEEKFAAQDDGTVLDAEGNTVAKFDNVADAIAYLQHMSPLGFYPAVAEDDRA